jgi:hypothetical protein
MVNLICSVDPVIVIIILELKGSFVEGNSSCRGMHKNVHSLSTSEERTFTFSVNFTILKGCDLRDRPDCPDHQC